MFLITHYLRFILVLVTRNRQGSMIEKDLSSSGEHGKKRRGKQSLQKKEDNSSINRANIKNSKEAVRGKKVKAEEVLLESSSDKDDEINDGETQKNNKSTVVEECNNDKSTVKENEEDSVESIGIKEKESLKEGTETKFKGLGSSSDDEDISVVEIKNETSNDDTKEEINKSKVCMFVFKK